MAYNFVRASSQGLFVDQALLSGAYPFSIAAWGRTTTQGISHSLVSITDKDSNGDAAALQVESSDNARAVVYDGATLGNANDGGVTLNAWFHILGTFTSDTSRKVYRDGSNTATNATNVTALTDFDRINIGYTGQLAPGEYWDGDLAEVAVWDVVLTDAEALMLAFADSPLQVRPASLIMHFPLVRDLSCRISGLVLGTTASAPTVVAHPRIFMPVSPRYGMSPAVAAATVTQRRTLKALGTRMGSRGAV